MEHPVINVYDRLFDYEDLKVAIVVSDYLKDKDNDFTYENIAEIVVKIRKSWENEQKSLSLTQEEIGYIQAYAWKYMTKYFRG